MAKSKEENSERLHLYLYSRILLQVRNLMKLSITHLIQERLLLICLAESLLRV